MFVIDPALMLSFSFFIAFAAAFLFWHVFAGKWEGHRIKRSLRFRIRRRYVHIHHWLWSLLGLVALIINWHWYPIWFGAFSGSLVQGLRYRDRFVILYHEKDLERIYERFRRN